MKKFKYILSLLLVSAVLSGCGGKKGGGGDGGGGGGGGNDDDFPPITDPVNPAADGATVPLVATNAALFAYSGRPINAPTDIKVSINLVKLGTYTRTGGGHDFGYGGYVAVYFKDNGVSYKDTFESLVNTSGVVTSNAANHKYNLYTIDYPQMGGKPGFHGFFEDRYGAVIVVIDDLDDLGDGQGPTKGSGSIYFKNHGLSYAPLSPTSCWFVSVGPYDCRTWKSGDTVQTKRSLYPESNYTKLGTFTDLDLKQAFNDEL